MERFSATKKPNDCTFDYNLLDCVYLTNGCIGIITGFGIYDNQYFCEKRYPDGVRLAGADYFHADQILGACSPDDTAAALSDCINEYMDFSTRFKIDWSEEVEALRSKINCSPAA